jgi:NAD+ synthase (glutamine-hydrolysing)
MKVALAQLNTTVGDLRGNGERLLDAYQRGVAAGAGLVLTPELALTGYPPQDLLFKSRFVPLNLEALDTLATAIGDVPLLVGYVARNPAAGGNPFLNAAALLHRGRVAASTAKSLLPTYDVFDEDRYFQPGGPARIIDFNGTRLGVTICEDIWPAEYLHRQLYHTDPVAQLAEAGAEIILNLSASPFHIGKPAQRLAMLEGLARRYGLPFVYCNAVGGNDQLVFDGNSLAVDGSGRCLAHLAAFREEVRVVDLAGPPVNPRFQTDVQELRDALVLGLRDYMAKCGFRTAVLGLSGGIDSAVTACLAVEALGAENVTGVAMPSRFSSAHSIDDARALADNLGIRFLQIPIQTPFDAFRGQFAEIFAGLPEDTTEENMQPRLRGMILMALSNKFGHLVLSTGNKSELAVGYCTLYGDMCGGLAVISDVPKTMVYRLARHLNETSMGGPAVPGPIPLSSIEKPPSAELKPDQTDQDTLPPYDLLDRILEHYVEEQRTAADIIALGYDETTVRWVARRVDLNEYKREQAAPGLRVTSKAFGAGRRMPLAQRFVD